MLASLALMLASLALILSSLALILSSLGLIMSSLALTLSSLDRYCPSAHSWKIQTLLDNFKPHDIGQSLLDNFIYRALNDFMDNFLIFMKPCSIFNDLCSLFYALRCWPNLLRRGPSPARPSPAGRPSPTRPSPARPSPSGPSPTDPSPARPSLTRPSPTRPPPLRPSPSRNLRSRTGQPGRDAVPVPVGNCVPVDRYAIPSWRRNAIASRSAGTRLRPGAGTRSSPRSAGTRSRPGSDTSA